MDKVAYYVTTPIYYVNDRPHIGHAYTSLAADVLARFYRLDGKKVRFLTGTDEHGQKVARAAQKAGESEQVFCDRMSSEFSKMSKYMNFSNDVFLRTTDEKHKKTVTAIWKKLVKQGDIYLDKYSGWYAISEECFYSEKELVVDASGQKISPQGNQVEWLEQESYFFRLSKWQEPLLDYFEKNQRLVRPMSRYNETVSFISNGLSDISISRYKANWGIKVPGNEKHRVYVWFDALLSYLTAADYHDKELPFWPPSVQLLGKDILRFHTIYWPALLMAIDMPLPKRIFAHGWWTVEGQKMSKSLGNVISPEELTKEFGLDAIRYYLLRDFAFGNDGDFAREKAKKCINTELANGIGNLVHRVLTMVGRYSKGIVPELGEVKPQDEEALRDVHVFLSAMRGYMQEQDFFRVMNHLAFLVDKANQYVNNNAPWNLQGERLATVMYVLLELLRCLAIYFQPFMPDTANLILDQLGIPSGQRKFEDLNNWIKSGKAINESKPIFARLE